MMRQKLISSSSRGGLYLVRESIFEKTLSEHFNQFCDNVSKLNRSGGSSQAVRSFTTPSDSSRYGRRPGQTLKQNNNKKRDTSPFSSSSMKAQKALSSEDLYVKTVSKASVAPLFREEKKSKQSNRDGNLFVGLQTDFPCLLKNPSRGPEPEYHKIVSGYKTFRFDAPFYCKYNEGVLPGFEMAYETWGELNEDRSNAILLAAGLSASSHAKSHTDNTKPGWWEKFIGPGCAVDTDKYFVICTNSLAGCYGSSGPSSNNPETGKPYGTTFPLVSVSDMVNAQFLLLDHLGIDQLYATVGSSLGGMCSLSACVQFPDRVGRMISISSCAESHPTSIAVRYLQRKCIMTDPNWNSGHYYGKSYPRNGMKLARELGTMTYRSGPEWDERFSRKRIEPGEDPALCPTFLIESYLDYQGEMFCTMYDPNSLLYISKAMDLFDVGEDYPTMEDALTRVKCPVMVIGVSTDILFPIWQQRELAAACRSAGNSRVTFYELDSIYGHDTFLLDLNGVGSAVKGFLETEQQVYGRVRPRKD